MGERTEGNFSVVFFNGYLKFKCNFKMADIFSHIKKFFLIFSAIALKVKQV